MARRIDDTTTLDPHLAFDRPACEVIANIYDTLVVSTGETAWVGSAAQSWSVSPDRSTWSFTMREGRSFASSQRPVTAQDAQWSLQRCVRLGGVPASILHRFGWNKSNIDQAIRVEHGRLVLECDPAPTEPVLLGCLSSTAASILDSEAARIGDDGLWTLKFSAGSGPYQLTVFRPNDIVSLRHRTDMKPGLSDVDIRHVPDPYVQLVQVQQGAADIARDPMPAQLWAARADKRLRVLTTDVAALLYLSMNTRRAELGNPLVREALRWAIDYNTLHRKFLDTRYYVHQSFLPRGFHAALERPRYSFKPDLSRALLAQAGIHNGLDLTLLHGSYTPRIELPSEIAKQMAQSDIRLTLKSANGADLLDHVWSTDFSLALTTFGADYRHPQSFAEAFCINDDPGQNSRHKTCAWTTGWSDAEIAQRATEAAFITQPEDAARAYRQLQIDVQEKGPFAIMFGETGAAIASTNLCGFNLGFLSDAVRYDTISRTQPNARCR
jgi:peptide/nickel transport system substrate-binding protein